jgi:enterochelin esterase-like enzyme
VDITGIFYSDILSRDMHYSIYLPAGYDTSTNSFPVLYLLHGMWGSYLDWPENGMSNITNYAIRSKSAKPMVIVMPDGLDAFYCNNYNGGTLLYEDFLIEEFFPYIESTYKIKTSRGSRAIAGLSMGGYGASFHAFKRPEMFSSCYSMSGALAMGETAPDLQVIINGLSPEQLARLPAYTMEVGTEDYLVYSSNVSFDAFLEGKGISHTFIARAGSHDWPFWIACLPKVLTFVSNNFE